MCFILRFLCSPLKEFLNKLHRKPLKTGFGIDKDTACYSPIEPYGFQAMKCKKIDSNYSRKYDKIRTFWIFIIASKSYGSVGLWQAVSKSLLGALFTFIVWGTWITNLEPLKWDGSLMTQRMRQGKKQSFFHAFFQRHFLAMMKKQKMGGRPEYLKR